MATAEGTRRFLARAVQRGSVHSSNVRQLGKTDLSCSAIGFGGYRVGGGPKELVHMTSIRAALMMGVNVFDTSSHYSAAESSGPKSAKQIEGKHGASERLLGKAIADAIAAGDATRDELILCTKVGHVERGSTDLPAEAVNLSAVGANDDWFSIHPNFVEAEVRASAERLRTSPDFVLLHNPEYFLSGQMTQRVKIGDAWDAMYERMERAFAQLEKLCDEGVIKSGYGVSGNFLSCMFSTTGRANSYEAVTVDRVLDAAATAAAGDNKHRMRLVQLPLNAVEGSGMIGRGGALPQAEEGDCTLASRIGLGVVTNRPLNSIPLPGVSSGDWGRSTTHIKLADKKPMDTVQALLKRVLHEAISETGASEVPLQQLALRLASAPPADVCLNGMISKPYIDDVAAVLAAPALTPEQALKGFKQVRQAMVEVGAEHERFW